MSMRFKSMCAGLALAATFAVPAGATVVEHADVIIGGTTYRAFEESSNGRVWLDLDNFFSTAFTFNSMKAVLAGSDFHIATVAEMQSLGASMDGGAATFAHDVEIVGGNYPGGAHSHGLRAVMAGLFDDGGKGPEVGNAFRFDISTDLVLRLDFYGPDVPVAAIAEDYGIWVAGSRQSVPEPQSLALVLAGLAGWRLVGRRRAKLISSGTATVVMPSSAGTSITPGTAPAV